MSDASTRTDAMALALRFHHGIARMVNEDGTIDIAGSIAAVIETADVIDDWIADGTVPGRELISDNDMSYKSILDRLNEWAAANQKDLKEPWRPA